MRRALFVIIGAGMAMLVLACGGGAAATLAPGATPAPVGQATTPPVAVPPAQICAAIPTYNPQASAFPSFAPDTGLSAKFPTAIDGNPVTDVNTAYYIQTLCMFGNADAIARAQAAFGNNVAAVSFGQGDVTIGDEDVSLNAFRLAGGDANQVLQHIPELTAALGADPEDVENVTTSQITLGGKTITVLTDTSGDTTWVYPSGDTLWSVSSDTSEEAAGTIFAALQ